MTRIGLLSDTHGYLDDSVFEYFKDVDEIWHAGDIGTKLLADKLESYKPFRAVYGNIDGHELRTRYPKDQIFELEGVYVWMTHIGGYPPRYTREVKDRISSLNPKLFICGHSHLLKILPDPKRPGSICLNPGAAGKQGFHREKTIVRFSISNRSIEQLEVVNLGKRAKI